MKPTLTIDDVAKLTSLSRSTIQVYASQKKIGTKIGAKRFFTKDDVKKLAGPRRAKKATAGGAKKASATGPRKTGGRKPAAKPPARAAAKKRSPSKRAAPARTAVSKPVVQSQETPSPQKIPVQRRSFLSFLGFWRKPVSQPDTAGK